MKTENLRISQLSPAAYDWYLSYLKVLDNNPPAQGRATMLNYLSQCWSTFGSLKHELLNTYGTDSNFVLEALNHYTRLDGKPVTVTAVAFTDRNPAGLVTSVRFYTDTTPVFASDT